MNMMQSHIKRNFTVLSVLTATGIILGYFENMLVPLPLLPGIKLGISNIVILFIIISFSWKQALLCGMVKAVVCGMFSGGSGIIYSVCGMALAVFLMNTAIKLYRKDRASETGLSILGSGGFGIGQIAAACFMLSSSAPVYYLPVILVFSVVSGAVTGILCHIICERIKKVGFCVQKEKIS